jgi:hypothetical protein
MIYVNPNAVKSPSDFIENIQVIFDGGENSYSLAKAEWEGRECFAIRWNVARREYDDPEKQADRKICIGMPSSHGYPVWFILPEDLLDRNSEIWQRIEELSLLEK